MKIDAIVGNQHIKSINAQKVRTYGCRLQHAFFPDPAKRITLWLAEENRIPNPNGFNRLVRSLSKSLSSSVVKPSSLSLSRNGVGVSMVELFLFRELGGLTLLNLDAFPRGDILPSGAVAAWSKKSLSPRVVSLTPRGTFYLTVLSRFCEARRSPFCADGGTNRDSIFLADPLLLLALTADDAWLDRAPLMPLIPPSFLNTVSSPILLSINCLLLICAINHSWMRWWCRLSTTRIRYSIM